MDKNRNIHDRIVQEGAFEVHRLPGGMQGIHQQYGLWIAHAGTNHAPVDGFHITPERYFKYYVITHLWEGYGRFWLQSGAEHDIHPGQCVITPPDTVNRYGGFNGQPFNEDTLCFTGPVADMLFNSGIITTGVFPLGRTRIIKPIVALAHDPARDAQINANIALQKLLVDIYNGNRGIRAADPMEKLLTMVKDQPGRWWTVDELAETYGLSMDQFRRVFKKHTGMLPKPYLDRLKLGRAAQLLASTDSAVADIAEQLGYRDCYHFSRRFKQVMGVPPRQYRLAFGTG